MKITLIFPTFLFIILSHLGLGQFAFNYVDSISVIKGGSQLDMPWAGGFNYAQFSDIDYDYDGDMDLLVFDRSNNQIKLFENKQISGESFYVFNPFGEEVFPENIRYRLFAIDYNGDNKKDLFTYGIGGSKGL